MASSLSMIPSELEKSLKVEKEQNTPRRLTDAEITDILSVIPRIKSSASEVGNYNRQSLLATLAEQLSEIVVTPLGIQDMKNEIVRQFNQSLIKPGSVVGVTAAEALGQPITQMALNSFHQSGSAKNVTYGVDRIRELINASKELKTTSCSIFFRNQNLSFDDVITKVRPALTEISVKDLVKGIPDIESTDMMDEPYWYNQYRLLIRDDFQSNSILTLNLDVDIMYAYKIAMADVAKIIERDQSVICVYSPLSLGIIHIYPIEKIVLSKVKSEGIVDRKNSSMIFLWEAVIPALDGMKITGVSGIRQIYPVEAPVWQIVKDEEKIETVERGWFLKINDVRARITGISIEKLVHLCTVAGMTVFKVRPNYIGVQTPGGESPTKFINDIIKADKEAEKVYEAAKRKEGARIVRRPPTEIMTASHLVYADSDGSLFKGNKSTLRTLLCNPNIDSTRTYSNNVHEIIEVLGLEAGRAFMIQEFINVIGYEGHYVNPRHIVLLVNFQVSLGQINGITFTGISRQSIGALEKASFEKAMDTFKEASGFGEIKDVKGTSASIYVGKRAAIGTGFSDQFMDRSKYKDIEKEIAMDPHMKLDIGAFQDAIGDLNNIISGADILVSVGVEDEMFAGEPTEGPEDIHELGKVDLYTDDPEELAQAEAAAAAMIATDIDEIPDPLVMEPIKGTIIRGAALEMAAANLAVAPCIKEPERPTVRLQSVHSPIRVQSLPFAKPSQIATRPSPTARVGGPIGGPIGQLPVGILTEMQTVQPKVSPSVIRPLVPLQPVAAPVPIQVPQQEKPQPSKIVFDLESFMK